MDPLWLFALGLFAQLLFAARMLVQWLLSEKARQVENPTAFWILGLCGSLLFLLYGWLRNDFALILGQLIGYYVYIWNLGAKGVWQQLGRWRPLGVGLLLLVPLVVLTPFLVHWPDASKTLFRNQDIPQVLLLFGIAGQIVFSTRFLYQALYSVRRKASSLPVGFWLISAIGAAMILVYGIFRRDPVLILAESFGLFTYIRNLMLWHARRENR
jgi:lipid-A-disaccharide synthase-like uncharacterized protein